MKNKILKKLSESGDYVSGQDLCDEFNVSRTAVWKAVEGLKKQGYEIEGITGKGYRLLNAPDLINETAVAGKLTTKKWGRNYLFFEETDSTNEVIKREAALGAPEGTLAVAELQTHGKGRRGRNWVSPKGSGVWMSFLLKPEINPAKASMLTLVSALAAKKACDEVCGKETFIKWPNDIVLDEKKICGMLTEMSTEIEVINYVVIGIGFNVNTVSFPDEIKETASSMYIETGKKIVRSDLIASYGKYFEAYYEKFLETGDLSFLKEEYNKSLVSRNRRVKIIEKNGEFVGEALGIDDNGELLVKTENGAVKKIMSGEVSVRGLYGYV